MNKFVQKNEKSFQNFQADRIMISNKSPQKSYSNKSNFNSFIKGVLSGAGFIISLLYFILYFGNQEIITKNSYILKDKIEKEYVSNMQYSELKEINEQNELTITKLENEIKQLKNQINNQFEKQ